MVKIIVVKKWDESEDMRMLTLIKMGYPIGKIMQYWPDCTRRQVEHHINKLCKRHKIHRPKRMRVRRSMLEIKQDAANAKAKSMEWRLDFTPDEIDTGRL